ncbi:MAG: hypothetical protein II718_05520 [Clostridiales bacterium]|nr:hypothetical protein [Clostridiales bacterium]
MATLTRLASTLTAKYFPSQNLTDAFYIDGRLFGKRETRQADITIDKEERGFFLSVFAHPSIPEYEPGMMPPYEPQLRGTCNEVKFGRKEIDGMIEGFLSTAVGVTGKMKLSDEEDRSPYFSGVIVRDAEAFAVTIGSGLAFLYRDDTLFPLTDAGIPMEPIDSNGNRVGDFMYYCSSKTANALWSNFFTLVPDDCIILCNKEIYDALGQREMLRILQEAEDQCDAAGVIITQASARMPNVPMQFSISFVESVTSDEKKGLFGFKRKNKEEDTSDMSIKSTLEGGVVGAASAAIADAGFTSGLNAAAAAPIPGLDLVFGDSEDKGDAPKAEEAPAQSDSSIEFFDSSVGKETAPDVTAEDMMKNLFGEMKKSSEEAKDASETVEQIAESAAVMGVAEASAAAPSPFVVNAVNPFEISGEPAADAEPEMKTISSVEFQAPEEDDDAKTKPIDTLNADVLSSLAASKPEGGNETAKDGIIEAALRELGKDVKETPEVDTNSITPDSKPDETAGGKSDEIVFAPGNETISFNPQELEKSSEDEFNPYSMGSSEEMVNASPLVFGDDGSSTPPSEEELKKASEEEGIPVPDFKIETEKPELAEEDKLAIDFPDTSKIPEEEKKEEKAEEAEENIELPFETAVETVSEEKPATPEKEDIPDMPVYDGNTFDTPVAAVNSDEPINTPAQDVYSYGQYVENENMAEPEPQQYAPDQSAYSQAPYQSFGTEGNAYAEPEGYQAAADTYGYQAGSYQGGYADQAAAPEAPASSDSDWINAILGIDDDMYSTPAEPVDVPSQAAATSGGAANVPYNYDSGVQRGASQTPYGNRPSGQQGRPGGAGRPRPASGNGAGGKGPVRRMPKLNRNGYIFLAFVLICLIVLIVLVSAIVRSCGKNEDAEDQTEVSASDVSEDIDESGESREADESVPEHTDAVTPDAGATGDPSAPIGKFCFSDYIGYRTWWDLFNQAYGIDDIANESDPRIDIIINYNGLDPATYSPSSGDELLLPPLGVLDGSIPVTFTVGAASNASSSDDVISGEAQVVDGAESGETQAEDAAAADAA